MFSSKNAALNPHPWSPEQKQAWAEMPLGPMDWIAPATERYRKQWQDWWVKWGKKYPYPPVREGYKELDRLNAAQKVSK